MISKTVLRWLTLAAFVGLSLGVMVPAASAAFVGTEIPSCPFTIGSSGNYFVKKNLTSTGTCIKVHESNVAIDLNGHTITGNGTGTGITDDDFFVEEVAISNGKIKDFDDGIDFFGCCFSRVITIDRVDSSDNKEDGIFIGGDDNSLKEVKANRNGENGIVVEESSTLFDNIQANDNKDDGIFGDANHDGLNHVMANRNGETGIDIDSRDNSISNSQANDNKGDGIFAIADNLVGNVTTNGNGGSGMDFSGFDNVITNSSANGNGGDGMEFGDFDNRVADSVANNNKSVGMDLHFGGDNEVTRVTANHNTTGVVLNCTGDGGNAVRVSAHGNTIANLTETGTCTNLDNNAP